MLLAAALVTNAAAAETVEEFFKRSTVRVTVGSAVGGGYDIYARLVTRHLGRFLPGQPSVIPDNMPGAGGVRHANYLYNQAPKDGSVIGHFQRGVPFEPAMGNRAAQYDPMKFVWLGNMNDANTVLFAARNAPVKSYRELFTTPLIVGGPVGDAELFSIAMNNIMGTKLKIVTGYTTSNEATIALERGELQGLVGVDYASMMAQHPTWIADGTIIPLVQYALRKHPDLPASAPIVMDLATTPEQRAVAELIYARQDMGRPFGAPPGVPADRVEALRKALLDMAKDADFLNEAGRLKLEVAATTGPEVETLLKRVLGAPPAIIERAHWAVTNRGFVEQVKP
jgi:tripartite-type tricarboxylate transporter receptor subunit TctC